MALIAHQMARSKAERPEYPNLYLPHRIKSLLDIKIMWVSAGPAAVHALVGDADGHVWTWGRNEKGQLGHGDQTNANNPKIVASEILAGKKIIGGAGVSYNVKGMNQMASTFKARPFCLETPQSLLPSCSLAPSLP
jgi:hypothetical protein